MIYLVDAFNLIYKFPELEEHMARGQLPEAMNGITELLAQYKQSRESATNKPRSAKPGGGKSKTRRRQIATELHLFFDGKRKRGDETRRSTHAGMQLYYSQDLSADHLIREFIGRHPTPADITVVSTDKQIREFARLHKCKRVLSEEFAEAVLGAIEEKEGQQEGERMGDEAVAKPSDPDTDYWLEQFRQR